MPKGDPVNMKDFQIRNCKGCRYADKEKIGTGEACCTFAFKLNINEDGKCLTRKDED